MSLAARSRRNRNQTAAAAAPAVEVGGRVERVVFHAPDSGYCVLTIAPNEETATLPGWHMAEEFTAVGHLARVRHGDEYRFTGNWRAHPKFGRQFTFTAGEPVIPTGREGVVRYLAHVVAGVGPVRAGQIVDALGEDALSKIQAEPAVLASLSFLSETQRAQIRGHLAENQALAALTALICRVEGVTPALAARVYRAYSQDALQVVKENPYVLAQDVWGVGFIVADRVARATGIAPDSPFRVEAAVEFAIREAQGEGHCFLRPRDLLPAVKQITKGSGVGTPQIAAAAGRLVEQGRLVRENLAAYSAIYPPGLYQAECELAAAIGRLAGTPEEVEAGDLGALVAQAEAEMRIAFHPRQREAVCQALAHRLSVITGGPGTGKTTIIRALTQAYQELHPRRPVYLASPTGRAAKRLAEATGMEAKTLHRLLEYHPDGGWRRNQDHPLAPGLLVVDEVSMVDLELAVRLFDALTPEMQVVLVGDADQLPSVGPGSVLRDLIASGAVPTVCLEYVYRQAEGSEIHLFAHQVREGLTPSLVTGDDVYFIACAEQEEAAVRVVAAAQTAAAYYGPMDYQVLCPMHRGVAGVKALGEAIREAVNPAEAGGPEVRVGPGAYRVGDKVMVIKNSYDLGVFNGDLGRVAAITGPKETGGPAVTVEFPDLGRVTFGADHGHLLTPAFASTIHKAQGSEFRCVILALTRGHYIMLARNLLYTAITRAKERLIVIHQPGAIERAVANDRVAERHGRLAERLRSGSEGGCMG